MVEIRNRFLPGLVERFGREHDKTQNAQNTPEESGREAPLPESTIQGEEVDDPQDEDYQIQTVPYYERRSNVGKPHNVHIEPREHAHYHEDENEDDATQHTGQTTPLQNAFLLCHRLEIMHHVSCISFPYLIRTCLEHSLSYIVSVHGVR